jgi:hypothetical protein
MLEGHSTELKHQRLTNTILGDWQIFGASALTGKGLMEGVSIRVVKNRSCSDLLP